MFINDLKRHAPVWAPAGDPPAGDPPAGDPPAGDPPAGDPPAGDPPTAKWWEGEGFTDEHRTMITAKGLAADDVMEVLPKVFDMQLNAERRLGQKPDDLMTKPKEGQKVAEWLQEHGDALGIPKDIDGYEIAKPEGWPEDSEWDENLAGELRTIAHEEGMSNEAANRMAELYAKQVGTLVENAERDLGDAKTKMMTDLEADFGKELPAKLASAQQAASVIAEKAGLDAAGMEGLAAVLKPKVGDAGIMRTFIAIADMMGDDQISGAGKGSPAFGTTPAEARQQLAALRAPDGAYSKATAERNTAELQRLLPEIDRLTKIAAGS